MLQKINIMILLIKILDGQKLHMEHIIKMFHFMEFFWIDVMKKQLV